MKREVVGMAEPTYELNPFSDLLEIVFDLIDIPIINTILGQLKLDNSLTNQQENIGTP